MEEMQHTFKPFFFFITDTKVKYGEEIPELKIWLFSYVLYRFTDITFDFLALFVLIIGPNAGIDKAIALPDNEDYVIVILFHVVNIWLDA